MPENVAMSPPTEKLLAAAVKSIDDNELHKSLASQEAALTASALLLDSLEENAHIFCSSQLEKPALMSLLLFQYPYSTHFALYQKALANQLAQCAECARKYHIALHRFSTIMLNLYAYDPVSLYDIVTLIQQWNHARLLSSLKAIDQKKLELHNLSSSEMELQLIPLLECLSAPQILEDQEIMESFQSIFPVVLALPDVIFQPKMLLPGVITFLFSQQKEFHAWALRVIDHMDNDSCLAENFNSIQVQAMENVVKAAMVPSSDDDVKRFWFIFSVLVRVLDKSVFIERLSGRPSDIIKFLVRCILARPKASLPYVLLALGMALDKLGSMFWPIVNPISTPQVVEAIISNHFFSLPESWSREVNTIMGFQHDIEDMTTWIMLLINSKPRSTMLKCEHAIGFKLIQLHDEMKGTEPEQFIVSEIVDIFAHSLSVDIEDETPFVYYDFLQQRLEMRILCSQFGFQVLDAYARYKSLNNFIRANSLATIYRSILLDVMSAIATDSQPTSDSEQSFSAASLWPLLNKTMPEDRGMIIQVLRAMTHTAFIKHSFSATLNDENRKQSEFALKNASVSLSTIAGFKSDVLMSVLEDDRAVLSIFMNLFSMDPNVYQYSLEILFQAYDVSDRSTALSALLNSNLHRTLKLYTEAIGRVRTAGSTYPILGVVKVTGTVANCLLGIQRVLKNENLFYQNFGQDLVNFWNGIWDLLQHIFKTRAIWYMNTDDIILLEFRRDLLDFVQQLISSFHILNMYVTESDAMEEKHSFLFQPILKCVIEMADIIAKTDDSYMRCYFEIIVSTLNVMKSFNIKPDPLKFVIKIFMSFPREIICYDQIASLSEAWGQPTLPAFIKNPRLPQSVSGFPTSDSNSPQISDESNIDKVGDNAQKALDNGAGSSVGSSKKINKSDQIESDALKTKGNLFKLHLFHTSMDAFYREVLSWDYHAMTPNPINLETKKPFPIPLGAPPYSFTSADDYQFFFWSRLIMGCWGDIISSKRTPKKPFSISIDKKVSLGHGACLISAAVILSQTRGDMDLNLKEGDLVVLSSNDSPGFPDHLARVNRVTSLGPDLIEVTLRVENAELLENLRVLSVFKLGSLSKVEAEYRALMDAPRFDFSQKILRAEAAYWVNEKSSIHLGLKAKYSLANSQARTVSSVVRSDGISLINGYGCLYFLFHVFEF